MANVSGKAVLRPVRRQRPVAIVGFGDSRVGVFDLADHIPIWSLNDAERYGFPKLDRVFELHPLRDIVLEGDRFERLSIELPYPVFMLDADPESFPSSVRYPIEAVLDECFQHIYVGEDKAKYLDSSFPYMLALAVLEGYNPIYVFGFELRSDTEYAYQRVGAALMIGWAAGRGVDVILPESTSLLPPTMYGYEDYQMISRQNLEQWLSEMENEQSDWQGRLNAAHNRYVTLRDEGAKQEKLQAADDERGLAYQQMYMRAGAITLLHHQIDICDRKQAALEFYNPFVIRRNDNGKQVEETVETG